MGIRFRRYVRIISYMVNYNRITSSVLYINLNTIIIRDIMSASPRSEDINTSSYQSGESSSSRLSHALELW